MSSHVEQIKERLPIQDVVGSYVKLERAGGALKARCPFHNEKSPSFFVSPDRGSYYCFGCGEKGDIFSFVERFENVDFRGALKILAERAGVVLTPENPKALSEKDRLFRIMEYATKVYEKNLHETESGKKALEYIKTRGLTDATISEWRVGYAPDAWSTLYDLVRKNAADSEIEKAGLAKKSEKGSGYYDRFRGRIMFPLLDPSSRVIAFSGRYYEGKDDSAKYLNSPETPLFHKSSFMYGYHKAKSAIRLSDFAFLVEGQMDLLMCHQTGFANTVATSGTSLTSDHLDIIRRLTSNLVIAFDGDKAGMRASTRAWELALSKGMTVSLLALPDGMDPADALAKDKSIFEKALADRKHIIDFELDHVLAQHAAAATDSNVAREQALAIKNTVVPYIAAVESSIEQSHFMKKVADRSGVDIDALAKDVRAYAAKQAADEKGSLYIGDAGNTMEAKMADAIASRMEVSRKASRQTLAIFGIVYWQRGLAGQTIKSATEGEADTVVDPARAEALYTRLQNLLGKNFSVIEANLAESKEELAFEAEAYYAGSKGFQSDVEELFSNLEMDILKGELESRMRELAVAERAKDQAKVTILLAECQGISKKMSDLKKNKT